MENENTTRKPFKVATSQTVGLWCPHCGNTAAAQIGVSVTIQKATEVPLIETEQMTAFTAVCPVCRQADMIPVDYELLNMVVKFNDLGYITYTSCQGHRRRRLYPVHYDDIGWIYELTTGVEFPMLGFDTNNAELNDKLVEAWRKLHGETVWRSIDMDVRFSPGQDDSFQLDYAGLKEYLRECQESGSDSNYGSAVIDFTYRPNIPEDSSKYSPERSAKTFKAFLERLYFELKGN